MSKYVDIEPILEYAKEQITGIFLYPQGSPRADEEKALRRAWEVVYKYFIGIPSANVAEIKHGRWIDRYNDGDWHCSECGAIVEKDEQNRHNWYRCYHCGAKMDEEK